MDDPQTTEWIAKWQKSGGAERANYQLFLTELCDVLGVPHPDPTRAEEPENSYVFEKNVVFNNPDGTTSTKRVDLYRRGCFVCETKQGVEAHGMNRYVIDFYGLDETEARKSLSKPISACCSKC
jgi:hypothetical protein